MVHRFWAGVGTTSEQRMTTISVAALDSSALGRSKADYTCDGTDDQEEINEALEALPSGGGRVVLLEGTFIIGGAITIPSNVSLEGQGHSTIIQLESWHNTDLYMLQNSDTTAGNSNIRIANLVVDGNSGNQTSGNQDGFYIGVSTNILVEDCVFQDTRQHGISIEGTAAIPCSDIVITRCFFTSPTGDAIHVTSAAGGENKRIIITSNIFRTGSADAIDFTLTDESTISYNAIDSFGANGILLTDCDNVVVDSNTSDGNTTNGISVQTAGSVGIAIVGNICTSNTVDGIVVNGPDDMTISANLCRGNGGDGISITGCNNSVISGNNCTNNDLHGMYFSTCVDDVIVGNSCTINSQGANNTYCNIILNDNVDDCNIQGNLCRHGGGAAQAKYGIHIANANCDTNVVTNNDCKNSGNTGDIQDDGTGTVTAAGNRT